VTRGLIGVRLQEITAELARALALPVPSGALVLEVFRGGPAERAAIRPGDVIVRFDGQAVASDAELVRLSARAAPGRTVDVELLRFGAQLSARVRIDEARTPRMPPPGRELSEPLGLQLAPLSARQRDRLRVENGLVVERASGAAERAGLARGRRPEAAEGAALRRAAVAEAAGGAAVRLVAEGTHTGAAMGVPPTGKRVRMTGLILIRWQSDQIIEAWNEFDAWGMMQQIAAPPENLKIKQ